MENRIIIFVDGSNFYHSIKGIFGDYQKILSLDFEKFIDFIKENRELVKIYYYNPILDKNKNLNTFKKQQNLFAKLTSIKDLELVLCRMQKKVSDGKVSYIVKEDDIHLAVDMMRLADNDKYDTAILVSSDGDFTPVIKEIKKIGKRVENIGFDTKSSYHLKTECDRFTDISKSEMEGFFEA